ncbi:putative glycosyltransferase [Fibrella aestuarina BUZ 2]|uniref:Putative glycosyltransferase n=1 Tax=Fibrella aestuarina BUZ 2 TaxID=1166018 RepID=I0K645_9BACT|nr:glycosyltransferase [Fibrella aestuarina]CCG99598.1 putative glycosyltransferase [Fibrella aestuarina BUZ 2]
MHVLFPIGTFYPAQSGGPSNSVYWLTKALRQQSVQVTVVSTDTDQPVDTPRNQWLDTDAGRVRYARTRHHRLPIRAIRAALSQLPTADVVHLTSLFYTTSLVVGWVALQQGKRIVWSPRGELAAAARTQRTTSKRVVLNWLKGYAHRITFHVTSDAEAADVLAVFGPTAAVLELPNYFELPPLVARQAGRYLVFLGRLHPIKGLENLVKALAQSKVFVQENWYLRLVGPDSDGYSHHLRELATYLGIAHRIQIEAPVAGLAKAHLLANAHALLLPSHSENFGNVVIEALAQGTPVIASTGTPWQLLADRQAGFWVSNQPDSLAAALDACLSLPSLVYATHRQNARRLAQEHFDSRTNAWRWVEAYERVLNPTLLCAE